MDIGSLGCNRRRALASINPLCGRQLGDLAAVLRIDVQLARSGPGGYIVNDLDENAPDSVNHHLKEPERLPLVMGADERVLPYLGFLWMSALTDSGEYECQLSATSRQ